MLFAFVLVPGSRHGPRDWDVAVSPAGGRCRTKNIALESNQMASRLNTVDLENLTEPQRDWVLHSEVLWRDAHSIAAANPHVDVGDVYHSLRCLELSPSQRLGRGLTRVRRHPHAG